jgi:WD40 repeat protein
LLSGGADATIIMWDIESGVRLRQFTHHHAPVHSLAFLPTPTLAESMKQRVLSCAADHTLILWNLAGEIIQRLKSDSVTTCMAVNTDVNVDFKIDRHALVGSENGRLCWWNLETGQLVRQWQGHPGRVCSVALGNASALGLALSGDEQGNVSLWDLATGGQIQHWPAHTKSMEAVYSKKGHFDAVWSLAFSPDGHTALSVSEDESALLWNLETRELQQGLNVPPMGLFSMAVTPDGRGVLLGTLDGSVLHLDPMLGTHIQQFFGHTGRVLTLLVTPDGRTAFSGAADGTLRQWDLQSGAEIRSIDYAPAIPVTIALHPDTRSALTGFWDGDLIVWDYASGTPNQHLRGHTEALFAGAMFSPDGRRVLSGAGDIFGQAGDATLRWWDIATGQELRRFTVHTQSLYAIALSANGHTALSAGKDGKIYRWDIANDTYQLLLDVSPQTARSIAISPDGHSALVGLAKGQGYAPDYALRMLDIITGQEIRRFTGHHEVVSSITFSRDGCLALSGDQGKAIIVWDVASGSEIRRLVGHTGGCLHVVFSADGRRALSTSTDQTVILWDVASGTALRRFWGHRTQVLRAIFGPEERTILSTAADGTVREWRIDATSEDLLAWIANHRYVPEFTEEQQVHYRLKPMAVIKDMTK